MSYQIGIIGAARRHQGTGPFVARTFAKYGHKIVGVVGTSEKSIDETVKSLNSQFGITTKGFTSFEQLLNFAPLDIIAICSPPDTHLQYLQLGSTNKLHVFCEKPLWWPANSCIDVSLSSYEKELQQVIDIAQRNKRLLYLNTQWPHTLRDYFNLYSDHWKKFGEIKHFAMHLCPQSMGSQMLIDAASHGLSMLYQLVGIGEIADIHYEKLTTFGQEALEIQFNYFHKNGTTHTIFGLTHSSEIPKPARYEINGMRVDRNVVSPGYQIQLQSQQVVVDIVDPLEASITDFIACIEAGVECDRLALMLGARHLYNLVDAYR